MRPLHKPQFPTLPDKLQEDLRTITPSMDGDLTYWPCSARMKDGTVLVCVYVVPEGSYIKHWGVYPQQDHGKSYISVSDVDALAESPRRLPAQFANKLYKSGESGMGSNIFTVVFAGGSRQAYVGGNAVDFIRYPEGKGQSDVIDVLPHEGRSAEPVGRPEYYWCLFSEKNIVVGGRVRVKPRSFLEQFQRESKYQHPISNEQFEAAGTTDTVKGAGIHRDGYALLELTATPGIWHEECLEWVEGDGNW